MSRRLYLLEDEACRRWHPFQETRPVAEILHGGLLLRERIQRATGLGTTGILGRPELEGFSETGTPPVLSAPPPEDHERLVFLSRYVPPLSPSGQPPSLPLPSRDSWVEAGGLRLITEGRTTGWIIPPGRPLPAECTPGLGKGSGGPEDSSDDGGLPTQSVPGHLLPDPWTLLERNPHQIGRDIMALHHDRMGSGVRVLPPISGVMHVGDLPVTVEGDVEISPGVVFDTRGGPIHLGPGVSVAPFTRLEGPAWIGAGSALLGGSMGRVSCGPVSKLHGEIDSSVILGYTNKAHDGYLGHALVGRWVNLGAFTTNSDLKNTYGTVRLSLPSHDATRAEANGALTEVDTGLQKVGVFLGDHVKTGIGTLLNTGTVVGAGSSLFAGPMAPRWVKPFSWGHGEDLGVCRKEAFLTTARRMMGRRDLSLTPGMERLLSQLWDRERGR